MPSAPITGPTDGPTTGPICILDDDPSVLRSIGYLLESDGLAALVFEDAASFLEHAHQQEVQLAVIDVSLGDANGIEVQAQLRKFSPQTRVIIMTGRDKPGLRSAAFHNGATAFLLKPFPDGAFLARVHEALAA